MCELGAKADSSYSQRVSIPLQEILEVLKIQNDSSKHEISITTSFHIKRWVDHLEARKDSESIVKPERTYINAAWNPINFLSMAPSMRFFGAIVLS